jgi:hypothetical protein
LEGSLDQKEIHFNFSPAHNLYRQRLWVDHLLKAEKLLWDAIKCLQDVFFFFLSTLYPKGPVFLLWNDDKCDTRCISLKTIDCWSHFHLLVDEQLSGDTEKAAVTTSCPTNSLVKEKQQLFLKLIPTISIEEDVGLREDSCSTWIRRPTLHSVASSCISGNSSMYYNMTVCSI